MRKALGVFLLLVLGVFQAQAADLRMEVSGEIGIDGQGKVFDYVIKTIVTPELKQLIDRSVRSWQFEPVLHGGKPGYAKADMKLTLLAKKVDAGYQLQVERVRFTGSRGAVAMPPPRYPMESARAGVMGSVLVALRVDAEGKVRDAVAVQTSLPYRNLSQKKIEALGKPFEKASIDAAKKWRFEAADPERGDAAETTLVVPVDFWLDDAPGPVREGWHVEPNSIVRPIPWLAADRQQFDTDGLKQGEALALDSPVKLKTEVAGHSL